MTRNQRFVETINKDPRYRQSMACNVTAANRPEAEAAPVLQQDVERQGGQIEHFHVDRGYITSSVVEQVLEKGGEVLCKP